MTITSSGGRLPLQNAFVDVTLFGGTSLFNRHADEKTEGFGVEHGRITLWLGPYHIFVIA